MPIRIRGRRQGSHTNTPHQPSQPSVDPPSLQRSLHSPGATSAIDLSASDGQPSFATRLVNGDQSTTLPTTVDPQPSVVPSSEDSHTEVDRRLVISVEDVSNPRRFVPSSLTRDIISKVISRMPYPADNWKSYYSDMKEMLFNDFKEKYHFSSNYDRTMAKTVWERTCMDRYPDYLAKARAAAFVRANSTNIADLKGHGPKGIRTEVWDGLVDIWMTPEWQRKSATGKSNRAAKPDSMVHTGGSRSFGHHKKKMESYETAMSEKYGEDSSTYPAVDSEIWLQAAGENKKGRVHDIGRSLDIGIHGSTHASYSDVVGPSTHPTPMTNEDVTTAINAALTSFMETQISQMQAQTQEQMQAQMQFFRTEILSVLKTQTQHSVQQPGENQKKDNDDDASLG